MTNSNARNYRQTTIKRLHLLSGNQCAAPDCERSLIARDGETIISKICHIAAASPDGPRWDPTMDDDQRRHFNNLILLCDECHVIIDNKDNESVYTPELLKEWKRTHESTQTYSLQKRASHLGIIVQAIADMDLEEQDDQQSLEVFRIEDKIEHNQIKRNAPLIEEYKAFYSEIKILYETLEGYSAFKKKKLLRNIKHIYLKVKGRYETPKADDIIEDIQEELLELVEKKVLYEDATFAISLIVVDAFMRCKILEEPPKQLQEASS